MIVKLILVQKESIHIELIIFSKFYVISITKKLTGYNHGCCIMPSTNIKYWDFALVVNRISDKIKHRFCNGEEVQGKRMILVILIILLTSILYSNLVSCWRDFTFQGS